MNVSGSWFWSMKEGITQTTDLTTTDSIVTYRRGGKSISHPSLSLNCFVLQVWDRQNAQLTATGCGDRLDGFMTFLRCIFFAICVFSIKIGTLGLCCPHRREEILLVLCKKSGSSDPQRTLFQGSRSQMHPRPGKTCLTVFNSTLF